MKFLKMSLIVIFSMAIFTCDTETSTSTAQAYIESQLYNNRIHIGVFEGVISQQTLVTTYIMTVSNSFSIDFPSGPNRIFLFVSENSNGLAEKIGVSNSYSVQSGASIDLSITMQNIDLTVTTNSGANLISWSNVIGASKYTLYRRFGIGNYVIEGDNLTTNNFTKSVDCENYAAKAYFIYFNLYTDLGPETQYVL